MPDSGVFSLPIVIRFDVLKNSVFRHASNQVSFSMNEFDFQRMKKALHRSIIMTVGSASHAAGQTIVLDQSLISIGTILAATIRVDDRALGKVAAVGWTTSKLLKFKEDLVGMRRFELPAPASRRQGRKIHDAFVFPYVFPARIVTVSGRKCVYLRNVPSYREA